MKILLVGNGGRENAMAWKIYNSKSFTDTESKMYVTIGNPGINKFAEPVSIKPDETKSLIEFALREKIDFTVVGPEIPLSKGIVNEFEKQGLKIFGPTKEAAEIESSKIFSKGLMIENNIPTAKYKNFSKENLTAANVFLNECVYPVVIKADGLAAGKGVVIINSKDEFESAVTELKSSEFIIEEFLDGEEVSVFAVTAGEDYIILPFSQDHKKIFEGETGKNTGGMGAVAPVKKFMRTELEENIKNRVIEPTLKALKNKGREFKGCLYIGLMIVDDEPFVIEYNCRFGDPETQAVLPLIESDFLQLLLASANKEIKNYNFSANKNFACCVVLASEGYPDKYETGKIIYGTEKPESNSLVFQSGTKSEDNNIITDGGRVLSVVGISDKSLEDAVKNAYENVDKISFENKYFRKDIGFRQLKVKS